MGNKSIVNRVVLTGASGMIGRAILDKLVRDFPDVLVTAVHFQNDNELLVHDRVSWEKADLRMLSECRRVSIGCDTAIMAAATTFGSAAMAREPWRPMNDNVIMNLNLLEAFHYEGIKRVIFISSATVYQDFDGVIAEDQLDLDQDPNSAYLGVGWGMRFIEKSCKFWHQKTGIEVIIVRASNIYGPYAIFDPAKSNVIPALIRKAVNKMDPFEVWGSVDVVRDVLYVDDFADAICQLLFDHEIKCDTFNVGDGKGVTVGEIMTTALSAANHYPLKIDHKAIAPCTTRIRLLDCSRIVEKLGWKPSHTLKDGIKKTTLWWIKTKNEWKK